MDHERTRSYTPTSRALGVRIAQTAIERQPVLVVWCRGPSQTTGTNCSVLLCYLAPRSSVWIVFMRNSVFPRACLGKLPVPEDATFCSRHGPPPSEQVILMGALPGRCSRRAEILTRFVQQTIDLIYIQGMQGSGRRAHSPAPAPAGESQGGTCAKLLCRGAVKCCFHLKATAR